MIFLFVVDCPGIVVIIFGVLLDVGVNVDMIVQDILEDGCINMIYLLFIDQIVCVEKVVEVICGIELNFENLIVVEDVVKVFVVGIGMCS